MGMKISPQRKLSQIHTIDWIWVARACDVCEENFHEWAQIREIRESFLPRKFPTIRYFFTPTVLPLSSVTVKIVPPNSSVIAGSSVNMTCTVEIPSDSMSISSYVNTSWTVPSGVVVNSSSVLSQEIISNQRNYTLPAIIDKATSGNY